MLKSVFMNPEPHPLPERGPPRVSLALNPGCLLPMTTIIDPRRGASLERIFIRVVRRVISQSF